MVGNNNNNEDNDLQNETTETAVNIPQESNPIPNRLKFEIRESALTRLTREDVTSRVIYCIFFVVLSCYFWTRIIEYIFKKDLREDHLEIVMKYMSGFDNAFYCWIVTNLVIILIFYPIIKCSAGNKCIMFAATLLAIIFLTTVTPIAKIFFGVRLLSAAALMIEQIRIQMKVIAFSVSISRLYREQMMTEQNGQLMKSPAKTSSLSSFVYFLFAPTLIYNESYPRSKSRNLLKVLLMIYELLVIFIFIIPIALWLTTPISSRVGFESFSVSDLVSLLYPAAVTGLLFMLVLFYGLLHLWMNIWAELLMFGDRQFYLEFWYDKDPQIMYRKWNLIVSNWCFSYVFLPLKEWSAAFALMLIIVLSAAMHEAVIVAALGYVIPVFFIFGCTLIPYGIILKLFGSLVTPILTKYPKIGHILVWIGSAVMWSMIMLIHVIEFWSRQNCPSSISIKWMDYFYPRTFSCLTLEGW